MADFLTLAVIYFVYMIMGAMAYRVPPTGWTPKGWKPSAAATNNTMITKNHVHVSRAWKTPQFWFLWLVLCLNVSAGIGIIGMASPLLQEVFGGKLLGLNLHFNELDAARRYRLQRSQQVLQDFFQYSIYQAVLSGPHYRILWDVR